MSLVEMRTAIVTEIRGEIADLANNCFTYGGRLDATEIKRIAAKSPACAVACIGMGSIESDGCGGVDALCDWAAFIVTTDKPQLPRDVAAMSLAEALARLVPLNHWGDTASGEPENIRAANLFNGSLEGAGVNLWAVTWRQKSTLTSYDATALADFLLLHVDYDLGPADGKVEVSQEIRQRENIITYGDESLIEMDDGTPL